MARANVVRISSFSTLADDLQTAIDGFQSYCRSKNLSGETLKYYGYRLLAFKRYLAEKGGPSAPKDLTTQTVRKFLTDEAEKKSATTASHSFIALSAFLAFMSGEGYIESNPMDKVEKPKRRKTVINTFSLEQIDSILTTCGKDFIGARDRAMIMLLIDSGLRASEIAGLETDDVNWTDQTVLVLGKGDKERVVPFGQATRQAMAQYAARRGELDSKALFVSTLGGSMDRYRIRDVIQHRCELAGITGVRCSPHTLRHSMAVAYLRNGGDVFSLQKLLGHSSLDMTRKYTELSQTDVIDKHRACSPADRLQAAKQKAGRKRLK